VSVEAARAAGLENPDRGKDEVSGTVNSIRR
jgi:hypothetical protein